MPTPAECVSGGQVVPGPSLVEALKGLIKQMGSVSRDVAVAIPAQSALVRRLPMPKLPLRRLRALIEGQGQQFIPFWRDGATFDLVVTNPNLSPTEQEILLVAVPTPAVDRLRTTLRLAGLRLAAVDVDILAVYRAMVATGNLPAGAPAAVLDAGHRRARLGLFRDGWPVQARTLDVLPLMGTETDPAAEFRYLTPEEFAVEVRRTMEILLSQTRTDSLDALALSARWPEGELAGLLTEEFRYESRTSQEFTVTSGGSAIPAGMAQAFGLSLAAVAQPNRLSLLPQLRMEVQRMRRMAMLVFVGVLLAAGAYGYFWWQEETRLAQETLRLTKAINQHTDYIQQAEKGVAETEGRYKAFDALRAAYATQEPWSVLYPHLKSLLPDGVRVHTITVGAGQISLMGKARDPEGIAAFANNLQNSALFEPPVLHTFSQSKGAPDGTFNITGQLKPRAGGTP